VHVRVFESLRFADEVIAACSNVALRRSVFSATIPQNIEALMATVLRNPIRILGALRSLCCADKSKKKVGSRNRAVSTVKQELVFVGTEEGKVMQLRNMISQVRFA
jgi:ATP-dependent RNA helicase DDX52/ROK1